MAFVMLAVAYGFHLMLAVAFGLSLNDRVLRDNYCWFSVDGLRIIVHPPQTWCLEASILFCPLVALLWVVQDWPSQLESLG